MGIWITNINGNIWITKFHLFSIQMPGKSSLFKPCCEYRTKSSLFKPSVTQPISQRPYDLNNELLFAYSGHGLNNEPFDEQTVLDHSNTKLVRYSDSQCMTERAQKTQFWTWHFGLGSSATLITLNRVVTTSTKPCTVLETGLTQFYFCFF